MKKILITIFAVILSANICYAADLSDWASDIYNEMSSYGILEESVLKGKLNENITREEFCELIMNVYYTTGSIVLEEQDKHIFSDTENNAVISAHKAGIVSGKGNGEFKPDDNITRQEMAVMISRTLENISDYFIYTDKQKEMCAEKFEDYTDAAEWAKNGLAAVCTYEIINGTDSSHISPLKNATREQAIAMVGRVYNNFVGEQTIYTTPDILFLNDALTSDGIIYGEWLPVDSAKEYGVIVKYRTGEPQLLSVSPDTNFISANTHNSNDSIESIIVKAVLDNNVTVFSTPYDIDVSLPDDYTESTPQPSLYETLEEKEMRVFANGIRFTDEEEAKTNMTEVTVPVWSINSSGEKISSKKCIVVNSALAQDVIDIFTEIYNDSSKFPIKDVGGYCWRNTAGGSVSEHSYGTCIDINYNENYYVTPDGTPITGSYWKPGEDPYSIAADSIVVKTFAKYGWKWGGNAWSNAYNKDYMHFTYLGR